MDIQLKVVNSALALDDGRFLYTMLQKNYLMMKN